MGANGQSTQAPPLDSLPGYCLCAVPPAKAVLTATSFLPLLCRGQFGTSRPPRKSVDGSQSPHNSVACDLAATNPGNGLLATVAYAEGRARVRGARASRGFFLWTQVLNSHIHSRETASCAAKKNRVAHAANPSSFQVALTRARDGLRVPEGV